MDLLKREKATKKTQLTKFKHRMLQLLDEDLPSRRDVRKHQAKLEQYHESVMVLMDKMLDICQEKKDVATFRKLNDEMDKLVDDFSDVQNRAQEYLDLRKGDASSSISSRIVEWQRKAKEDLAREIQENEQKLQKVTEKLQRSLQLSMNPQVDEKEACSLGEANSQVDVTSQVDDNSDPGEANSQMDGMSVGYERTGVQVDGIAAGYGRTAMQVDSITAGYGRTGVEVDGIAAGYGRTMCKCLLGMEEEGEVWLLLGMEELVCKWMVCLLGMEEEGEEWLLDMEELLCKGDMADGYGRLAQRRYEEGGVLRENVPDQSRFENGRDPQCGCQRSC